jgi:ABC-type nitrate/sulfonate/bicarbonate transport system permease component
MAISSPAAVAAGRRPAVRGLSSRITQLVVIVVLLVLWQITATLGRLGAVPTPVDVAQAMIAIFVDGSVWAPLGATLVAWALSLMLAVLVGVVVGFPLGVSRVAYRLTVFALDFLRTIPALVLVPLVVLLYGSGMESTVLLAFFGAVWAVIMQTIYGALDVDPTARQTFLSFRVRPWVTVRFLLIPSAMPYIATGIRLAAAICLLVTISAQIVIPAGGLGEQILTSQLGGAVSEMYAYIFICGALGVGVNGAFSKLEAKALAWHPSHRKVPA